MVDAHPFADAFNRHAQTVPARERGLRSARFAQFSGRGLPTKDEEDWRHSDLAQLNGRTRSLASIPDSSPILEAIVGTDRLVYIDGHLDAGQSTVPQLSGTDAAGFAPPAGDDSLSNLNVAFSGEGLIWNIAAHQRCERPLHLILAGKQSGASVMHHQRHRISLGEAAEACLIIESVGLRDGDRFSTQVVDIELAANARLDLYRVQRESAGASTLIRTEVRLARDSRLRAVCIDGGFGFVRQDLNVALQGCGAEAELNGLFVAQPGAHVDNQARVIHEVAHCRSRAQFRGIAHERSRATLNGKVVVRPGAQKTDSELRIATLLLSRKAEINAKPDLEIYADDVKCAHGLTVGQLDDVALGYLRSRGLPEPEAKALLIKAFSEATLDRIAIAELRTHVESVLALAEGETRYVSAPGEAVGGP